MHWNVIDRSDVQTDCAETGDSTETATGAVLRNLMTTERNRANIRITIGAKHETENDTAAEKGKEAYAAAAAKAGMETQTKSSR